MRDRNEKALHVLSVPVDRSLLFSVGSKMAAGAFALVQFTIVQRHKITFTNTYGVLDVAAAYAW